MKKTQKAGNKRKKKTNAMLKKYHIGRNVCQPKIDFGPGIKPWEVY